MDDLFHGLVIGLHLVSAHVPDNRYLQNENPGIYVRTESGWTAGIYRNSLRRTSVYGGFTFTTAPVSELTLSLTVGAVTGYKRERVYVECPYITVDDGHPWPQCYNNVGYGSHNVTLMLAPSVAFLAAEKHIGVVPRLSYIPRIGMSQFNVFHLSVEKSFY